MQKIVSLLRSSYAQSMTIRILNAALSLGISILLARLLGPEEYGRYGVLLSFAVIMAIPFTAGLPQTLTKQIAVARVHQDNGLIRKLIKLGMQSFLGLVLLVCFIAVALYYSGFGVAGLEFGILLAAVVAPVLAADSNRYAVMRGLGSAIKSQVPNMLIVPIGTMVIVLVLLATIGHANAVVGLFSYCIATLLSFILGSFLVKKALKSVPDNKDGTKLNRKDFYISIVSMSLLGGVSTLTGNIDMMLLNQFSSLEAAGHYKVALAGLAIVVMGGNAVSAVSFTRLAEAIPTGDKLKIAIHSDQALKWGIVFTFGVTGVVALFGGVLIELLYGKEYSGVWSILIVLSIGFCIASLFGQAPEIAALSGSQIPAAVAVFFSILITITISYLTFNHWGVLGIAVGSMAGTISRYIVISIIVYRKLGLNITIFGFLARRGLSSKCEE